MRNVLVTYRFRIRQETKFLAKTYYTIERDVQTYYRPVAIDQSERRNVPTSYPEECTCATLQMRDRGGESKMATLSLERQSLYSSI